MTIFLVVATMFISDGQIRKLLFYSVLITALVVIVVYILITAADHERLREEVRLEIDQVRRQYQVDRALIGSTLGILDADLKQIRKRVFADITLQSAELDEAEFASAISHWLTEDRDG